jgi:hypothetical protein
MASVDSKAPRQGPRNAHQSRKTFDMAEDIPCDISTFGPRHRLNSGRQTRSAGFTVHEKTVIPWPLSNSNEIADPTITNVQIAIQNQVYAEELRELLEEDNQHRAYVVDRPNSTVDGLVVLDETTLGHVGVLEGTDALRYIVLGKESFDPNKLWKTGVRCVVPAEYPPSLVRMVVLGSEVRLNRQPSGVAQQTDA